MRILFGDFVWFGFLLRKFFILKSKCFLQGVKSTHLFLKLQPKRKALCNLIAVLSFG